MELVRALAAQVGEERYQRAREEAWRTAGEIFHLDRGGQPATQTDADDDAVELVPHELADWIWYDANLTVRERLDFALTLYRDMPSYANLMYVSMFFPKFETHVRTVFWDAYRALLGDADDRLANPVAYSLWVDYFEDAERAAEAWDEMTRSQPSERSLKRLVPASGPVPYELKAPLYQQLALDQQSHEILFRGLFASQFDIYGKIDVVDATQLLYRVDLAPETQGLHELRVSLAEAQSRKPTSRD